MKLNRLLAMEKFSRQDYVLAYKEKFGVENSFAIDYALRKSMSAGEIIHIGRNQYTYDRTRINYSHKYSAEAICIASEILEDYPTVDFRIFELIQLNRFVNHLFAHNSIFVYVENDVMDFVFDALREKYPGRVLFKPKIEEYYRYLVDDQIVILRLPSETPKGVDEAWHCRLEKILVDIVVDKFLSKIVSVAEFNTIFMGAVERYLIDENVMFRYAKRKGADRKFKDYVKGCIQSVED